MTAAMRFASHAVTNVTDVDALIPTLITPLREQLGADPDLLMVFFTPQFLPFSHALSVALRESLRPGVLLGCSAEAVIETQAEHEGIPAVSAVAAILPDIQIMPFALNGPDLGEALADPRQFWLNQDLPQQAKLFVMLGDPFTMPIEGLLDAFNTNAPGVPLVGGMASGALRPGGNVLLLNEQLYNVGAVGVALEGALQVDVIVSQGCRPVGEPFTVTAALGNAVLSIENNAPATFIHALHESMSLDDRALLQNGLFIGRAIDPGREVMGRGDFLVRGVLGIEKETGAMLVGDVLRTGETAQFHLRDASTAAEDLELLLLPHSFGDAPAGGFLFSCNGRGERLYDHPNGDVSRIQAALGSVPLAGFFAGGELGPIGRRNFLHGHTASLVLLRPA